MCPGAQEFSGRRTSLLSIAPCQVLCFFAGPPLVQWTRTSRCVFHTLSAARRSVGVSGSLPKPGSQSVVLGSAEWPSRRLRRLPDWRTMAKDGCQWKVFRRRFPRMCVGTPRRITKGRGGHSRGHGTALEALSPGDAVQVPAAAEAAPSIQRRLGAGGWARPAAVGDGCAGLDTAARRTGLGASARGRARGDASASLGFLAGGRPTERILQKIATEAPHDFSHLAVRCLLAHSGRYVYDRCFVNIASALGPLRVADAPVIAHTHMASPALCSSYRFRQRFGLNAVSAFEHSLPRPATLCESC